MNGLAKRFVRHCRGVELLDLVQDGNEALVHAEKDVRDLIVLQEQAVVSIHAFPDGDEDCTLEDTIVDPLSLADSDEDLRDLLADALVMLPDRERIVINLRYGFEDGQARTQKEVAYLLGVSAARVAQLDRRAQMRLRKLLCAA